MGPGHKLCTYIYIVGWVGSCDPIVTDQEWGLSRLLNHWVLVSDQVRSATKASCLRIIWVSLARDWGESFVHVSAHWPLGDMEVILKVWSPNTRSKCTSCEIVIRWMPQNTFDDKSTLVQVMAWCCQATIHYLSQCWRRSVGIWRH